MKFLLKTVALALILGCFVTVVRAQAQSNNCQNVRLLLQAKLDFAGLPPQIGWFGPVRGFLNDKTPLTGTLYGVPDGPAESLKTTGQAAHEWGRFVFDFGAVGKFLTTIDRGVFHLLPGVTPHMTYDPVPPAQAFGFYAGNVKVEPGESTTFPNEKASGAFINTTGNLSVAGYFLVNAPPPANMGVWNAEITGKLCNVDSSKLPPPLI